MRAETTRLKLSSRRTDGRNQAARRNIAAGQQLEQGETKMTNEPGILCRVKIAMRNGTITYVIARSCTEGREIAKRLGHDTRYARVSLDGVVTPPLIDVLMSAETDAA